jgi:arylsulfatase A-like enzyme
MYEGGVREPLIISWPGKIMPGSVSDTPVTSPDFYPTLLEAAGLPLQPEQHTDGVSLLDHIRGGEPPERDALFWHYPHYGNQGGTPGSSVRMGDYKLIEFFEDGRLELYNLKDDISEEHDLSDEEPGKTEELHTRLIAWRESVNALTPEPNPEWDELA